MCNISLRSRGPGVEPGIPRGKYFYFFFDNISDGDGQHIDTSPYFSSQIINLSLFLQFSKHWGEEQQGPGKCQTNICESAFCRMNLNEFGFTFLLSPTAVLSPAGGSRHFNHSWGQSFYEHMKLLTVMLLCDRSLLFFPQPFLMFLSPRQSQIVCQLWMLAMMWLLLLCIFVTCRLMNNNKSLKKNPLLLCLIISPAPAISSR